MESVLFLMHSDIPRLMPQTKWKYQYRNVSRNLFFKVDSDGLETLMILRETDRLLSWDTGVA